MNDARATLIVALRKRACGHWGVPVGRHGELPTEDDLAVLKYDPLWRAADMLEAEAAAVPVAWMRETSSSLPPLAAAVVWLGDGPPVGDGWVPLYRRSIE